MGPICFDAMERARSFLLANIAVSDDCSSKVRLDVEHDASMSRPGLLLFKATATDERCEGDTGVGIHSNLEMFEVELFDGWATQGLLRDRTVVKGLL